MNWCFNENSPPNNRPSTTSSNGSWYGTIASEGTAPSAMSARRPSRRNRTKPNRHAHVFPGEDQVVHYQPGDAPQCGCSTDGLNVFFSCVKCGLSLCQHVSHLA